MVRPSTSNPCTGDRVITGIRVRDLLGDPAKCLAENPEVFYIEQFGGCSEEQRVYAESSLLVEEYLVVEGSERYPVFVPLVCGTVILGLHLVWVAFYHLPLDSPERVGDE